jgi:hypothetical protein
MIKRICLVLIGAYLAAPAQAQTEKRLDVSQVPEVIRKHVIEHQPLKEARYHKILSAEDTLILAEYAAQTGKVGAVYTEGGELVEMEKMVDINYLPKPVADTIQGYLKKRYLSSSISQVLEVTLKTQIYYDLRVKVSKKGDRLPHAVDLLFDHNGINKPRDIREVSTMINLF